MEVTEVLGIVPALQKSARIFLPRAHYTVTEVISELFAVHDDVTLEGNDTRVVLTGNQRLRGKAARHVILRLDGVRLIVDDGVDGTSKLLVFDATVILRGHARIETSINLLYDKGRVLYVLPAPLGTYVHGGRLRHTDPSEEAR